MVSLSCGYKCLQAILVMMNIVVAYIIFLLILILAGLAAGIAGFVLKNKVKEYVTKSMTEAFDKYKDPSYQKIIDTIQKDLKCCGANGTWAGPGSTPTSCQGSDGQFYNDGCVKNVQEFLKKNILIVAGCVFGFALIQILGVVFAACVCQAIKRGETA
ncbi:Tetraspanin [Fasciola hepatica]|uniref:Tetraspanin n=1 Tax=Fasciola hepatica TaxID=6192 RepID=A0A4E0R1A8_FASHE|nr:Tetraspanin [Fasciola hepatica]